MIKIAVVDDSEIDQKNIITLINKYITLDSFKIFSFQSGIDFLKQSALGFSPDIIFMDIQMEDLDGISSLEKYLEYGNNSVLFFVTGYAGFVSKLTEIIRLRPAQLLRKPIDENVFAKDFQKAISACLKMKTVLAVKIRNTIEKIIVADIVYIEVICRKTTIFTKDGKSVCSTEKLCDILSELKILGFSQIHKSIIVNLNYVKKFKGAFLSLDKIDQNLPISRNFKSQLMEDFIMHNKEVDLG